MDFLQLAGKKILIFGIANRKSVAFHIAKLLKEAGAEILCSVQTPDQARVVEKYFPDAELFNCDVTCDQQMTACMRKIKSSHGQIYGIVHSIAWANYADGIKPFHETGKEDFLQAFEISCHSFIRIAGLFKPLLDPNGAMVTISISETRMAAENYGYMAPIKAALDSSVVFLAKSLSSDTNIRVNGVGAAPLKTSSSAGIPGYLDAYMYAEKVTLRKSALKTPEVANTAAFLLSPRSSGINAQIVVVDAGMSVNYFDKEIVSKSLK